MFGWLWTALNINGVVEFGIELQSDEQFRLSNHFLRERNGKADLEWLGICCICSPKKFSIKILGIECYILRFGLPEIVEWYAISTFLCKPCVSRKEHDDSAYRYECLGMYEK